MATVNTIKTRILNRYDLLDSYNKNNDFIPYKGEICIAEIPTTESKSGLTPPAIGIKVGDGDHPFSKLNWIQAIAGDVAAWLKELTGIADIDTQIANLEGRKLATVEELQNYAEVIANIKTNIGDTKIFTGDDISSAIKALQDSVGNSSEGLGSQVAGLKTDLTELQGRVTTVENDLNAATTGLKAKMDVVQAAAAGYDASKTIAADIKAAKDAAGAAQSKADANEKNINTLVSSDANKSVRDIAIDVLTEKLIAENAKEALNTLEEIAAWIQSHPDDASAMNDAIKSVKANLGYTTDAEGNEIVPDTVDARIATAAEGKVTALANGAVRENAENIGRINTTLAAMNVTDNVNGVVTKVDQADGKISVTHKKITMDEMAEKDPADPSKDYIFIFYCGTASDVI